MAQAIPDGSTVWIKDKHSAESFVKSTVRHGPGITDTVTHLHKCCTCTRAAHALAHALHVRRTFAARSLHTHRARSFLPGRGYIVTTPGGREKTLRPVDVSMANPTGMVRPDNCQLLHLSESTILHNVRRRFEGEGESEGEGASPQLRAVYTYTGSILLALNPFEKLPLYGTEQMRSYVGRPLGAVAPHTYAMAEEAYRCLLQTRSSQSLVVSGESGAGKTEANKQLMRYLAFRAKKGEQLTDLASTILQSNPVLEAFGNAKTARNDNSSRFGKFVKIAMSDTGEVPRWCTKQYCHFTCFLPYLALTHLT